MAETEFNYDFIYSHKSLKNLLGLTEIEGLSVPDFLKNFDLNVDQISQQLGWNSQQTNPIESLSFQKPSYLNNPLDPKSKGIFTISEFFKHYGEVKNLPEKLDPYGVKNIVSSVLEELRKIEPDTDFTQIQDEAKKISERIDDLRYQVFSMFETFVSFIVSLKEIPKESLKEDDPIESSLIKFINFFLNFFDDSVPFENIDVETQLFKLKETLFSFEIQITRFKGQNQSSLSDQLNDLIPMIRKINLNLNETIHEFSDISPFLFEDVKGLNPLKGEFKRNGDNQKFNVIDFRRTKKKIYSSELNNPYLNNFRRTYVEKAHSSVSKLATSYVNIGENNHRTKLENIEDSIPQFETAAPSDTTSDKVQDDQNVESQPLTGTVGPLNEQDWENYKNVLGQRESGNDYSRVNTIGFAGRWQFGGPALADLGYVKPGTRTRALKYKHVWTGKDGISSRDDWLSNKGNVQDKAILLYTRRNYRALLRLKVITRSTDKATVAGYLMAAHLKGPGGARKLKNGRDNRDAYGTTASSYFNLGKSVVSGGYSGEAASVAKNVGGSESDQARASADSTTIPSAPRLKVPVSYASPRYPYNHVRETESGHIQEFDDTPGFERIAEHHRVGTGYEISPNGDFKRVVVGESYTAVMGSNHILVQGHCHIIAHGDVNIKSDGNMNINAGQDLNMLVGGDFNLIVSGEKKEQVSGSSLKIVDGDDVENITGFKKLGVDGDLQMEGASTNIGGKDGEVNIAAVTNINAMSIGEMNLVGKSKSTMSSTGDVIVSSGSKVGIASDGAMGLSSGEDIHLKSENHLIDSNSVSIKSEGQLKLDGSDVSIKSSGFVDCEVKKADWANRAGVAPNGNPGTPPVVNPPAGDSKDAFHKDEHQNRQGKVSSDGYDKSIDEFDPVDSGKTQGWSWGQGGGDYDGKGYSKGISEI